MTNGPTQRRHRRGLITLALCSMPASAVFAADNGCYHSANGYYEIIPPEDLIVSEAIPPGKIIRDYAAHGNGNVLATCMAGTARLEGGLTVANSAGLVPLTIGGRSSGFGVRLYIREITDGRQFDFPHQYTRNFSLGDPIRTSDADIGVKIERMAGPVLFGKVDVATIAKQWAYQPNGVKTDPFRHVSTTNIVFSRPTCTVVPDDLNQTVSLKPLSLSAFANADRATPWEAFHIGVADCEDPKGLIARFTFGVPGDADATRPDLFWLSGLVNVGLELGDDKKQNIAPARPVDLPALATGQRYDFFVRMRETRPTAGAGVFTRPVKVVVEYM